MTLVSNRQNSRSSSSIATNHDRRNVALTSARYDELSRFNEFSPVRGVEPDETARTMSLTWRLDYSSLAFGLHKNQRMLALPFTARVYGPCDVSALSVYGSACSYPRFSSQRRN